LERNNAPTGGIVDKEKKKKRRKEDENPMKPP